MNTDGSFANHYIIRDVVAIKFIETLYFEVGLSYSTKHKC